jgi:hypothetical protein
LLCCAEPCFCFLLGGVCSSSAGATKQSNHSQTTVKPLLSCAPPPSTQAAVPPKVCLPPKAAPRVPGACQAGGQAGSSTCREAAGQLPRTFQAGRPIVRLLLVVCVAAVRLQGWRV